LCNTPSIIVGRKGSAGELNLTEAKFWPLDVTYFVTFDEGQHDLRFLYHLLTTLDLPSLAKGVKPGINRNEVYSLTANIPPLPEQRRIVGILDEAFDGIATAKANAEKNLQNAQNLFQSVLDEAISGRLTNDWRLVRSITEGAFKSLTQVLTQRRKDWSGAGKYTDPSPPVTDRPVEIPGTWVLASPEQLATHIVDCPHSTPKWTKTGMLCLRTTNFKPGFLDLKSVQFVSKETYTQRIQRLEPMPGDVVYSREGGILGIACIIPEGVKTCLGQRMMQFRLDTEVIHPQYFTAVMNSGLILAEVKRLTGGAAAPHLNIRDIRTFPIPLPPMAEQRVIMDRLNSISTEGQRLESVYQRKLAALEALKKSLLHQAFTGGL
jgi:type I restriction enzyme S subunit